MIISDTLAENWLKILKKVKKWKKQKKKEKKYTVW